MANQLSRNFFLSEFQCKCNCGIDFVVDPKLVRLLQEVRNSVGQGIIISSGARCPEHNKAVHGSKKSWHIPRNGVLHAADIQVMDPTSRDFKSAQRLYVLADVFGAAGLGLYKTWTHLDTRRIGIMAGQDRSRWIAKDVKFA